MLNRTVIGVVAMAIALAVLIIGLRFCSGGSEPVPSRLEPTTLIDSDLAVSPGGANALGFVLASEATVEVEVAAQGRVRFFDVYVMNEADWKAVKIPGGEPMLTMQKVAQGTVVHPLAAGSWRVVVHDAHAGTGMTVHVRVVATPRPRGSP